MSTASFGIILFVAIVLGAIGDHIACVHNGRRWAGFWFGFCFGPIGWIILMFLKDLRNLCPMCKGSCPQGARKCMYCGESLETAPAASASVQKIVIGKKRKNIPCPMCGRALPQGSRKCIHCGEPVEIAPKASAGRLKAVILATKKNIPCSMCGSAIPQGSRKCIHCGEPVEIVPKASTDSLKTVILATGKSYPCPNCSCQISRAMIDAGIRICPDCGKRFSTEHMPRGDALGEVG